MYAGADASAIHAVAVLLTPGAMKTAIEQKHPDQSAGTLSTITVIATVVLGLIGAVLFIWVARACLRGKSPARITAAVLAAPAHRGGRSAWPGRPGQPGADSHRAARRVGRRPLTTQH
jgi:hypothetical protein